MRRLLSTKYSFILNFLQNVQNAELMQLTKMFLQSISLTVNEVAGYLNPPILNIYCVSVAYNNTFVVLTKNREEQSSQDMLINFDLSGKILFQRSYSQSVGFFGMMNDREVIYFNKSENKIDIINLENHDVKYVNHKYLAESQRLQINTFSQTKLLGIFESDSNRNSRFTYYRYDSIQQNSNPLAAVSSSQNNLMPNVQKMNDHSKIGWTHIKEGKTHFTFFDLKDNSKGKYSTIIIQNQLYRIIGLSRFIIKYLWEIKPHIYFFGLRAFRHRNQTFRNPSFYIIDASISLEMVTLKKANFMENIGFKALDSCFRVGNVSVFHLSEPTNEQHKTPVFFVSNETEQIIHQDTWIDSPSSLSELHGMSKYFFPGWDESCLIEAAYDDDSRRITVKTKKIRHELDMKAIQLDMLLFLNQDFDDDLLHDAVQSLIPE